MGAVHLTIDVLSWGAVIGLGWIVVRLTRVLRLVLDTVQTNGMVADEALRRLKADADTHEAILDCHRTILDHHQAEYPKSLKRVLSED